MDNQARFRRSLPPEMTAVGHGDLAGDRMETRHAT